MRIKKGVLLPYILIPYFLNIHCGREDMKHDHKINTTILTSPFHITVVDMISASNKIFWKTFCNAQSL